MEQHATLSPDVQRTGTGTHLSLILILKWICPLSLSRPLSLFPLESFDSCRTRYGLMAVREVHD